MVGAATPAMTRSRHERLQVFFLDMASRPMACAGWWPGIAAALPGRRIHVVADAAYAGADGAPGATNPLPGGEGSSRRQPVRLMTPHTGSETMTLARDSRFVSWSRHEH